MNRRGLSEPPPAVVVDGCCISAQQRSLTLLSHVKITLFAGRAMPQPFEAPVLRSNWNCAGSPLAGTFLGV